ncbi:MAG: sarcosine oxidase subunit gamma family protein [Pseudomonadota bacterium]
MSDAVSALMNASDDHGLVTIKEIGPMGMITLRGDLGAKALQRAAAAASGAAMPDQRQVNMAEEGALAWMSPDELLILCPYTEVAERLESLQAAFGKQHALAVNVSDARAVFEVKGARAREVMAKLVPVDLAPGVFTPGMFRRTRLAQVAAAFWMPEEATFRIVCFRSVARYVFDVLKVAAQPGSEVDHFPSGH